MYQRTYQDLKRWNPMIDRIYFERHPQHPEQIRTYTMKWNAMANKITPMISNWHTAEPTPEMLPYHPKVMGAVLTQQSTHMGDFY
jgi:hypothetical protein